MARCDHRAILVIRSYDLERERALCLSCHDDMPEWKSIPHAKRRFIYRYISSEDMMKGVVPELSSSA